MKKIFLVKGSCGSYDDFLSWIECAYLTKEKAEECARKLGKSHQYQQPFEDDVWFDVLGIFEEMLENHDIEESVYENSLVWDDPKYEEIEQKVKDNFANTYLGILHKMGLTKATLEDVMIQMECYEHRYDGKYLYNVEEVTLYEK